MSCTRTLRWTLDSRIKKFQAKILKSIEKNIGVALKWSKIPYFFFLFSHILLSKLIYHWEFQIWISLQIIDLDAFEWTEFGRSHYCAILKKEHLNLVHWVQCFRAVILCENVLQASKWDLTWWGVWSFSSCFKVSSLSRDNRFFQIKR